MLEINQAFVFIKPHAVNCEYVKLYIDMLFKQYAIRTISTGTITGPEIKAKGLIDKHYAVNAHSGTIKDPSELFVPQNGLRKFQDTFGTSWQEALDENLIISGQSFQDMVKVTSEELFLKWTENGFTKICPGIYIGFFQDYNRYVINGFYTSNRDMFTADDALIEWSVIEFQPEKLSWFDFRHNVIGITNPANAAPNSIRGFLFANREKADIPVSYKENIIHASASPFEALIEKDNWLQQKFDPMSDPLFKLLSDQRMDMPRIRELYRVNPIIQNGNVKDKLVNILEDRNTKQNFEIITSNT